MLWRWGRVTSRVGEGITWMISTSETLETRSSLDGGGACMSGIELLGISGASGLEKLGGGYVNYGEVNPGDRKGI
jgi:hypothetical protein